MERQLQHIAERVRHLLGCSAVILILECPDSDLQHPLLRTIALDRRCVPRHCGAPQILALLQDERIRALYDMAMQTGMLWSIDSVEPSLPNLAMKGVAIAPLERPNGMLGFFLCAATHTNAFYTNRCSLLEQHLPEFAMQVERALSMQYDTREPVLIARTDVIDGDVVLDMQEQSTFISLVGHELRVPLTAIKGYAGLLQAYGTPVLSQVPNLLNTSSEYADAARMTPERQQQYLRVIVEQTSHLEVLINDLLDVSRLQSGRLALRHMEVDVAVICQRVVQVAQRRIAQALAVQTANDTSVSASTHAQTVSNEQLTTITCTFAPNLPKAWADPDRIEQVLTNLVDNAIKYSPDGGQIELLITREEVVTEQQMWNTDTTSTHKRTMVCMTVRDQGIGISPQQQQMLFQPFKRLEHPATGNIPGYGLGLYLSRKLVEAMDGKMILSSSSGVGTSVTCLFPTASLAPLENFSDCLDYATAHV